MKDECSTFIFPASSRCRRRLLAAAISRLLAPFLRNIRCESLPVMPMTLKRPHGPVMWNSSIVVNRWSGSPLALIYLARNGMGRYWLPANRFRRGEK